MDELCTAIENELQKKHISLWRDVRRIKTSDQWKALIQTEVGQLDLAVLLVSKNFQKSRFIQNTELPWLRSRRLKDGMRLFAIVLDEQQIDTNSKLDWLRRTQYTPKGSWVSAKYVTPDARRDYFVADVLKAIDATMADLSEPKKALADVARF